MRARQATAATLIVCLSSTVVLAGGYPVIDAANLIQNILQQIEHYISMITMAHQLRIMIREGDYYGILLMHMNNLGLFFPDADVGSFTGDIADARNAYQGFSGGYGGTKSAMNEVFGGGRELVTPKWNQIEFMDAAATRSAKEIGTYRSGRALRDMRMEQIVTKANGSTGQDRQLQLANVSLANLFAAIADQSLMTATTGELLATKVEARRAEMYLAEEGSKTFVDGLLMLFQGASGDGPQEIEVP